MTPQHKKLFALVAALTLTSMPAFAVPLSCATDARTDRKVCYAPSEVREKDGIRTAPFYTGGPNAIRATPYTLAINCATSVLHIKDRDGVSFAGGQIGLPQTTRDLRQWICEEKLPAPKGKKK